MSEVTVKFSADDAALWAAIQRQIGAAGKQKTATDEVAKAGKNASKEMDRFAESVKKITATPVERFKDHVKRLDDALKAQKITQEQHTRAVMQYKDELLRATAAQRSHTSTTAFAGKELKSHTSTQQSAIGIGGQLVSKL